MKTFIALTIGVVFGAVSGSVGGTFYALRERLNRPPLAPPPVVDIVQVFNRAIVQADTTCGPVPFDLRVRADEIGFTCGRPVPVVKTKVPGARVAEATP
jgi:hypothetical protein